TPLPKKLGVDAETRLLVDGAPSGFDLGGRPVRAGPIDVALVFVRSRGELTRKFDRVASRVTAAGAVWVCWPKKASKVETDMTENVAREVVLPTGFVDVKVCAVDAVWSGLKFVRRRENRVRSPSSPGARTRP